jgi:hypothetical protein
MTENLSTVLVQRGPLSPPDGTNWSRSRLVSGLAPGGKVMNQSGPKYDLGYGTFRSKAPAATKHALLTDPDEL